MLERREKLFNHIADALDPELAKNRDERMELMLSALYELDETTKVLGEKSGPITIEAKKLRVKIKDTADTKNEDIIAVRGVLTAVMREPEYYGFSPKMIPLLVKLYGADTISIIPKHKSGEKERETANEYVGNYIKNKMNVAPKDVLPAEIMCFVMLKIQDIYKKFAEAVEKNVLRRLSAEPGITGDDIPGALIDENAKSNLSEDLKCSEELLRKKPEIKERYDHFRFEEENKQAPISLRDIKTLIETTQWELGKWGSKSKITVDGEEKEIPNHMKKIYDKIVYAEKNPDKALDTLKEIHSISQAALHDKPVFFSSYRERFKTTTKAYEKIEEQSRDLKL